MPAYYQKSVAEISKELSVEVEKGLSPKVVSERLVTFGRNVLAEKRQETIFDIFIRQFKSPLIYVLILAAVFVLITGGMLDALVIVAVISFNSIIGTIQEGKARNSLARLKTLTRHKAIVRRLGEEMLISAEDVVVGDILVLKEGDRICADARIFKSESLKTNESILTGEAQAVDKTEAKISKENLVVGDQKNMVFAGTSVVGGYGEAIIVATGVDSELGRISKELVQTSNVPFPLAQKILKLTHFIAVAVLFIAVFTLAVGLLRGIELKEILGAVIGLSVSIIPEGLPVAVTIVLASGVWRMAKAHAIVRQMAAVEAMGNADTLLVDKTGTITTGKMVIKKIRYGGKTFEVSGEGYDPKGSIKGLWRLDSKKRLTDILSLTFLSLKADVVYDEHRGWKPSGDSTEAAIAALCAKLGLSKEKLSKKYKVDFANPFDPKKRYIEAAFLEKKKKWKVFVGAPEFLNKNLSVNHGLIADYHELTKEGFRVIGASVFSPGNVLYGYVLLAIDEEVRAEVRKSVAEARNAGFRIAMITGDFEKTAKAIAKAVGIYREGDLVLTGEQIQALSAYELSEKIEKVTVFARIAPEDKLLIVNAYKRRGHVCAMTGDGVNDAPALAAAHLGIAVGSGTQVAKDSADIVLVNDNFETIVDAIAEGRSIYLSLKKIILYLFSTSLGEVFAIAGAVLIGLPLPLVATQIIWLNFVTDGFFVVALAQDTPRHKLLNKDDVESDNLIDSLMIRRMVLMALAMFFATMPVFIYFLNHYSIAYARTIALIILSVTQWANAFNVRSRTLSVFQRKLDNRFMIASVFAVLILQILVVETSIGNRILHTENIRFEHWLLVLGVSSLIIWVEEVRKFLGKSKVQSAKLQREIQGYL